MKRPIILTAALSLFVATACATHEQAGTVAGAGVGAATGHALTRGSAVGTLLGAFIGAAIGADIGRQMDAYDRKRTAYALEYYGTGEAYVWVNPDTGYEYHCTPREAYDGAEGPCRDFVMQTYIDGRAENVEGTACRQPDGSWRMAQ